MSSTTIDWTNQTLNYATEGNENVTFYANARVSKGCVPIIELKLYSSMDVPFSENKLQDKCKIQSDNSLVLAKVQPVAKVQHLGMILD